MTALFHINGEVGIDKDEELIRLQHQTSVRTSLIHLSFF